jgi:hypothetical protein
VLGSLCTSTFYRFLSLWILYEQSTCLASGFILWWCIQHPPGIRCVFSLDTMQGFRESWIYIQWRRLYTYPSSPLDKYEAGRRVILHSNRPYSLYLEVETEIRRVIVCANDSRDKHRVKTPSVMSYWRYWVHSKSCSGYFSFYLHIWIIIRCSTEVDWSFSRFSWDRAMNSDGSIASTLSGWLSFLFLYWLDPMLLVLCWYSEAGSWSNDQQVVSC